jgi:hypothetical protein
VKQVVLSGRSLSPTSQPMVRRHRQLG